jgi:hypothetical protein
LARLFSIVRFALASSLVACASAGTGTASQSSDFITSAEIRSASVTNALDLITRLRPAWLRPAPTGSIGGGIRNQVVAVYLDGHRLGDLESLRTLSVTGIGSVQWLDAIRAGTILTGNGSDPISGAILFKSR